MKPDGKHRLHAVIRVLKEVRSSFDVLIGGFRNEQHEEADGIFPTFSLADGRV
jgi:hypothetical protein